ncbi:PD-(D/E)XK nuclease family protein [Candidatus Woesearchaeota archaeon]|nr:PD-(D/E)XK nuclease family protein [Candidatus Woesearchaeota archaeon]
MAKQGVSKIIKHLSLDHLGGYYHYRTNNYKVDSLCNDYPELVSYLNKMFEECPNDYFESGPRSSSLKFKIENLDVKKLKNHEVCELTSLGLKENKNRYLTAHSKVQVFMLEKDDKTLAVEVPLWLEHNELNEFQGIFNSVEPLTGHIDVLRLEDGKIWIWDYKPDAAKEKYASTQVYFYTLMLSKRTGIPLDNFRCGYFDEKDAFIFKPVENIKISKELKKLFEFL